MCSLKYEWCITLYSSTVAAQKQFYAFQFGNELTSNLSINKLFGIALMHLQGGLQSSPEFGFLQFFAS